MNPQQFYGGSADVSGYQQPGKKLFSRKNVLIVVFSGLILLTVLAGILSATNVDKPDKLMQLAIQGNADDSYALLGPKAQQRFSSDTWRAEVSILNSLFADYTLDTKQTSTDDDGNTITTYRYNLVSKNTDSGDVSWVIIKSEDPKEGEGGISDYRYQSIKIVVV